VFATGIAKCLVFVNDMQSNPILIWGLLGEQAPAEKCQRFFGGAHRGTPPWDKEIAAEIAARNQLFGGDLFTMKELYETVCTTDKQRDHNSKSWNLVLQQVQQGGKELYQFRKMMFCERNSILGFVPWVTDLNRSILTVDAEGSLQVGCVPVSVLRHVVRRLRAAGWIAL
jgi:hypothetical protein